MLTDGDVKIGRDVAMAYDAPLDGAPLDGAPVDTRISRAVRWLCLCAALVLIASIARMSVQGVMILPWIQIIFAPLIVLAISQISICDRRIPLWVSCTALAGILLGGVLTYSHVDLAQGAFVVARFEEDALEKETKIFRDRIRKTVGWGGITLVGSHYDSVRNESEARGLLVSNRKLGGVIWGTPRWLNVSLQQHPPLRLFEGAGEAFASDYALPQKYRQLKIITFVSGTGLSTSAEYPTVEFLGGLAQVWRAYLNALTSPQSEDSFEMLTRSLAAVKGRWTTFSHRALPMWMTGTFHLRRAVVGDMDSPGELSCAIRAFTAALAQLRPGDNPELKVAVLNNLALAYIIRAQQVNHRAVMLKQAKLLVNQAVILASQSLSPIRDEGFKHSIETLQGNANVILSKKGVNLRDPGERSSKKDRNLKAHEQSRRGQKQ